MMKCGKIAAVMRKTRREHVRTFLRATMGNTQSPKQVGEIHENIKQLEQIGLEITDNRGPLGWKRISQEERAKHAKIHDLYKSFYYPTQCLRQFEEMNENHYHLRQILEKHITLYNKYNSTDIDVDDYVKTTLKNLQPTLRVIGV